MLYVGLYYDEEMVVQGLINAGFEPDPYNRAVAKKVFEEHKRQIAEKVTQYVSDTFTDLIREEIKKGDGRHDTLYRSAWDRPVCAADWTKDEAHGKGNGSEHHF